MSAYDQWLAKRKRHEQRVKMLRNIVSEVVGVYGLLIIALVAIWADSWIRTWCRL